MVEAADNSRCRAGLFCWRAIIFGVAVHAHGARVYQWSNRIFAGTHNRGAQVSDGRCEPYSSTASAMGCSPLKNASYCPSVSGSGEARRLEFHGRSKLCSSAGSISTWAKFAPSSVSNLAASSVGSSDARYWVSAITLGWVRRRPVQPLRNPFSSPPWPLRARPCRFADRPSICSSNCSPCQI